jgi:hypothetical protein
MTCWAVADIVGPRVRLLVEDVDGGFGNSFIAVGVGGTLLSATSSAANMVSDKLELGKLGSGELMLPSAPDNTCSFFGKPVSPGPERVCCGGACSSEDSEVSFKPSEDNRVGISGKIGGLFCRVDITSDACLDEFVLVGTELLSPILGMPVRIT